MRLTFVRDDDHGHQVIINGESREIPEVPATVPANIYAVQVYTTYTEVEFINLTNSVTSEPPDYVQQLVAAWEENEPVPEPEPEPEAPEEPSETGE